MRDIIKYKYAERQPRIPQTLPESNPTSPPFDPDHSASLKYVNMT